MAKSSKNSGGNSSATASTVLRTSKPGSFVVSQPLTQSEIVSLKERSKQVAVASSQRSKDGLFVERRPEGDYAVRRAGSLRASAVLPTQSEAIARARELSPKVAPLVERVRTTHSGGPDKWRKA